MVTERKQVFQRHERQQCLQVSALFSVPGCPCAHTCKPYHDYAVLCFICMLSVFWIACTSHKTLVIQKYIYNTALGKSYDGRWLKKERSIKIYILRGRLYASWLTFRFTFPDFLELDRIIVFS